MIQPELVRFAFVLAAGLIIDLGIGFVLASVLDVPLALAAALGFAVGALFNYVLHEIWTFRTEDGGLSPVRALLYLGSSLLSMGVRIALVSALSPLAANGLSRLSVLALAAFFSFIVNYLLSRFVVYYRGAKG